MQPTRLTIGWLVVVSDQLSRWVRRSRVQPDEDSDDNGRAPTKVGGRPPISCFQWLGGGSDKAPCFGGWGRDKKKPSLKNKQKMTPNPLNIYYHLD